MLLIVFIKTESYVESWTHILPQADKTYGALPLKFLPQIEDSLKVADCEKTLSNSYAL